MKIIKKIKQLILEDEHGDGFILASISVIIALLLMIFLITIMLIIDNKIIW